MATYVRTRTLTSQLVVHALCLALVLEGCRLEIGVLAEDFKLSLPEARGMLRELVRNCTLTLAETCTDSRYVVCTPPSHRERLGVNRLSSGYSLENN